ncbi:unnamed protein product [Didymodactylos carnosus]|uniref:Uncharacterized protein n=1 Tax=Didymodactylos carnosus TaxID=1234261 RepID=A0A815MZW8_9BILA|nr:unnamed protein product [Didymodactylos carnosus]CAF1431469.1 unnamed protein product [Didymodactylos carnosus]CAF3989055.1 unnamed protein product [Didymodactylos carnosus]CAF4310079.1 unnamed protein product [Didymodactylos carnosus]
MKSTTTSSSAVLASSTKNVNSSTAQFIVPKDDLTEINNFQNKSELAPTTSKSSLSNDLHLQELNSSSATSLLTQLSTQDTIQQTILTEQTSNENKENVSVQITSQAEKMEVEEQSSRSSNVNNRKRTLPREEEETTTTIDDEHIPPVQTSRRGGSNSSTRGRGDTESNHGVT